MELFIRQNGIIDFNKLSLYASLMYIFIFEEESE